ncbi:hypothetical protein [Caldanaerobacter sp.]|uniref:hypothetical protein n=1 Tax=Caldanaerobacter sp. TaxID=2930036 RepID=UPI003C73CF25
MEEEWEEAAVLAEAMAVAVLEEEEAMGEEQGLDLMGPVYAKIVDMKCPIREEFPVTP